MASARPAVNPARAGFPAPDSRHPRHRPCMRGGRRATAWALRLQASRQGWGTRRLGSCLGRGRAGRAQAPPRRRGLGHPPETVVRTTTPPSPADTDVLKTGQRISGHVSSRASRGAQVNIMRIIGRRRPRVCKTHTNARMQKACQNSLARALRLQDPCRWDPGEIRAKPESIRGPGAGRGMPPKMAHCPRPTPLPSPVDLTARTSTDAPGRPFAAPPA
jgi:hypothetical protein